MNFSNFQIVYLLTSFFGSYTVYKLLDLFFSERRTSSKVCFGTYALYTVVISILFIKVNVPLIMLIVNLSAFLLLTYNYHATFKSRLLAVFFIIFILAFVEVIVGIGTGYFGKSIFEETTFNNSFGLVANKLVAYMAVLLFGNFKSIKEQVKILPVYWLSVFFIPTMSLYLVVVLFQSVDEMTPFVFISLITVFMINLIVFYLYDVQHKNGLKLMENELLMQQNRYYENQFELMKNSEERYHALKHEWRNHMSVLSELTKRLNTNEAQMYIMEMARNYSMPVNRVATGNQVVDSILNFKYVEAEEKQIALKYDLELPETLNIPAFDLSTILSNLIDNGIEALERHTDEKTLHVTLRYVKKRLLIETTNPYDGKIVLENNKIKSTKQKTIGHGMGLNLIKKTVEKYNGEMHIHHDEQLFKVKILLYV